ncbi:hypothetical protein P20652_1471 [Pseudoalteromonas sp. BSi20652]|nr:hypothetical protein P20652_1471 [Pseudoalteromonas sp. BSi20652]
MTPIKCKIAVLYQSNLEIQGTMVLKLFYLIELFELTSRNFLLFKE